MNARRKFAGRSGISVVELLVMITVASLVGFALSVCSAQLIRAEQVSQAKADAQAQAQNAMAVISQKLRHGTRSGAGTPPNVVIPASPNNTQLTFYVPADVNGNGTILDNAGNLEWATAAPVQFVYDQASGELRNIEGGVTRVLASNVTAATFEDSSIDATLSADEVRVRVTVQKRSQYGHAVPVALTGTVKLRN